MKRKFLVDIEVDGKVTTDGIQLDLSHPLLPIAEGTMSWNADDGTGDVGLPGGVVGQMFQEQFLLLLVPSIFV